MERGPGRGGLPQVVGRVPFQGGLRILSAPLSCQGSISLIQSLSLPILHTPRPLLSQRPGAIQTGPSQSPTLTRQASLDSCQPPPRSQERVDSGKR